MIWRFELSLFPECNRSDCSDSHACCDGHNTIHCFYTWMTWILHSLSSLNLFKSWQFMLHYSTLLVLIIRLKPFLHEINWNFSNKQSTDLLYSSDVFLTVRMTNKPWIQRSNAQEQTFLHTYSEVFQRRCSGPQSISKVLHISWDNRCEIRSTDRMFCL